MTELLKNIYSYHLRWPFWYFLQKYFREKNISLCCPCSRIDSLEWRVPPSVCCNVHWFNILISGVMRCHSAVRNMVKCWWSTALCIKRFFRTNTKGTGLQDIGLKLPLHLMWTTGRVPVHSTSWLDESGNCAERRVMQSVITAKEHASQTTAMATVWPKVARG